MATNYDSIARMYDITSRLVFGRKIVEAQLCLLGFIKAGDRILIVGGGTGWILERIAEKFPSGLTIDYVESSGEMIALSQEKKVANNAVNFIHLPVENFTSPVLYDVIFTPFVFDNFKPVKAEQIFTRLNAQLKAGGIWLYADFIHHEGKDPLWQQLLLKVMYVFFSLTTNIETNELVRMDDYFLGNTYQRLFEQRFYAGFMKADAYQKPETN